MLMHALDPKTLPSGFSRRNKGYGLLIGKKLNKTISPPANKSTTTAETVTAHCGLEMVRSNSSGNAVLVGVGAAMVDGGWVGATVALGVTVGLGSGVAAGAGVGTAVGLGSGIGVGERDDGGPGSVVATGAGEAGSSGAGVGVAVSVGVGTGVAMGAGVGVGVATTGVTVVIAARIGRWPLHTRA